MAKKVQIENLIASEVKGIEEKIKEFQDYLRLNSIISKVNSSGEAHRIDEIELTIEDQEKLHKEILIQIKMNDALFNWLPLLKKLRETDANKSQEMRGGVEVNGMFKTKDNG